MKRIIFPAALATMLASLPADDVLLRVNVEAIKD